jgi:hypothetical protein
MPQQESILKANYLKIQNRAVVFTTSGLVKIRFPQQPYKRDGKVETPGN